MKLCDYGNKIVKPRGNPAEFFLKPNSPTYFLILFAKNTSLSTSSGSRVFVFFFFLQYDLLTRTRSELTDIPDTRSYLRALKVVAPRVSPLLDPKGISLISLSCLCRHCSLHLSRSLIGMHRNENCWPKPKTIKEEIKAEHRKKLLFQLLEPLNLQL